MLVKWAIIPLKLMAIRDLPQGCHGIFHDIRHGVGPGGIAEKDAAAQGPAGSGFTLAGFCLPWAIFTGRESADGRFATGQQEFVFKGGEKKVVTEFAEAAAAGGEFADWRMGADLGFHLVIESR